MQSTLESIISTLEYYVWSWGIPVGDETIPFIVIALLSTGLFLTLRLSFIQIRHLGHGFAVATGKYDDPDEPGDVSHFQALTTALSATVGIGNIAGVAIAIHWGGPGALFWMWVTAFLGMALKFSEVTLAQRFRHTEEGAGKAWEGSVSGGPMYYMEKGLGGPVWKVVAIFFSVALICTSFLTGNGVQANTIADTMSSDFGVATWITGLVTATLVGLVIIGGIKRIGAVTGILAPAMAALYALGAITIIIFNVGALPETFALIFKEAFNPTAGVAGTGAGALLTTLMWGVRRGLFSNEAGQGSAPIAHAAAKTDEPVSEGVVALLEPFIDTIVICTMTGLVILLTGVWNDHHPTEIDLNSGDMLWIAQTSEGDFDRGVDAPESFAIVNGAPRSTTGPQLGWHNVIVDGFFVDEDHSQAFTGQIAQQDGRWVATAADGTTYETLHGNAVETGAPLTQLAFKKGLSPLGDWGGYIVLVSVLLFGISTAISWSYYGDRCANYIFGTWAILPYKLIFVLMHFYGAISSLAFIWTLGDVALGFVTFPNLIAVIFLSGALSQITKSYFERKPWVENAEVHKRVVAEKKAKRHKG